MVTLISVREYVRLCSLCINRHMIFIVQTQDMPEIQPNALEHDSRSTVMDRKR